MKVFTAAVKRDGDWWIGWVEDVPGVNCQEPTREKLLELLCVTLAEALDLDRNEACSVRRAALVSCLGSP